MVFKMEKSKILTDQPSDWVERKWREYASQIYKQCRYRSIDKESAMDLFQEVALRFCKSSGIIDQNKPLLPWFSAVIRNTHHDLHRRVLKTTPLSKLSDCRVAYHPGFSKERDEIVDFRRERFIRGRLDLFMQELSSAEKLAVEFSCIGGISAKEACVYCGVDKGTFSKRKCKAIKKMKAQKESYLAEVENNGSLNLNLDDLLMRASEFS